MLHYATSLLVCGECRSHEVGSLIQRWAKQLDGRAVLLGVDGLDATKVPYLLIIRDISNRTDVAASCTHSVHPAVTHGLNSDWTISADHMLFNLGVCFFTGPGAQISCYRGDVRQRPQTGRASQFCAGESCE